MSSIGIASAAQVNWRAVVFDAREGIVVVDVEATTDSEAKGKADSLAATHLSCGNILAVIVLRHADMPPKWMKRKTSVMTAPEQEFYKGFAESLDTRKIEYKG
jgi:hypothetical protein